jgi:hypothetical protein
MTTETQVYNVLQHPFFILIVGAIITYVIAPQLIKIWQANEKRTELKYDITEQITESVSNMLLAIDMFKTKRENAATNVAEGESEERSLRIAMKPEADELTKKVSEWDESCQKIAIRLHLYFHVNDIETQWNDFCKKMKEYKNNIASKSNTRPTKEEILMDNNRIVEAIINA